MTRPSHPLSFDRPNISVTPPDFLLQVERIVWLLVPSFSSCILLSNYIPRVEHYYFFVSLFAAFNGVTDRVVWKRHAVLGGVDRSETGWRGRVLNPRSFGKRTT